MSVRTSWRISIAISIAIAIAIVSCVILSAKRRVICVGGGYLIHMFGAYFGLTVTIFLTSNASRSHPDNTSCYSSDLFAMIGTLFLWICWPSFNAAVAAEGQHQSRAFINTFLSLTAATATSFVMSRFVGEQRFEMVHIQNSTLAGGVAMGAVADLNLYPAVVIGVGAIAGIVSVLGYRFLTPFMNNYLHCQVRCHSSQLQSTFIHSYILPLKRACDPNATPPIITSAAGYLRHPQSTRNAVDHSRVGRHLQYAGHQPARGRLAVPARNQPTWLSGCRHGRDTRYVIASQAL